MLEWIASNIANIVITVILLAAVSFAVITVIRNKKKGKSSCGCDCGCCPMSDCKSAGRKPTDKSGTDR